MEEKRMIKVMVDGVEYAYPQGTPYRTIAAGSGFSRRMAMASL